MCSNVVFDFQFKNEQIIQIDNQKTFLIVY